MGSIETLLRLVTRALDRLFDAPINRSKDVDKALKKWSKKEDKKKETK